MSEPREQELIIVIADISGYRKSKETWCFCTPNARAVEAWIQKS